MVGGDHSFFVRFLPLGKDGVAPRKENASACFSLRLRSAAHRAGANKRSVVCRQNVVLFQVRCRMKKDNPFGLPFFGYTVRNSCTITPAQHLCLLLSLIRFLPMI